MITQASRSLGGQMLKPGSHQEYELPGGVTRIVEDPQLLRRAALTVVPDLAMHGVVPVVFVCAPLRSTELGGRVVNMAKARQLMMQLQLAGMAAICVHTMCEGTQDEVSEQLLMDYDLSIIKRCDAILLGDGWVSSEGCKREVEFAHLHRIPCYKSVEGARAGLVL